MQNMENCIDWKKEIARYIQSLDRSAVTKDSYNRMLLRFYEYLVSNNKLCPNKEDLIAYKEYLKKSVGAATVSKVVVVLRGFFIDLAGNNIYPNVMLGIRGEKISKDFKRSALTLEEVSKLLKKAKKLATNLEGKRNYALVALISTCGLRTIEIERANKADLSTKADLHILYIQGKGRSDKSDYAKLSPEVYEILEEYLLDRTDNNEALFVTHERGVEPKRLLTQNVRRIVKELLRRINIDDPHYSTHSLRHAFATNLIKNGMSIEQAKLLLRHKDLSTTMIYIHGIERDSNDGELIMSNLLFGGNKNDRK